MKALVWRKDIGLEEWEQPQAREGEVLVPAGPGLGVSLDPTRVRWAMEPRDEPPGAPGPEKA